MWCHFDDLRAFQLKSPWGRQEHRKAPITPKGTVMARTLVTTQTLVIFWLFYICTITLRCVTILMMLNWLKILKNNVNLYIYSYFNILHFLHCLIIIWICDRKTVAQKSKMQSHSPSELVYTLKIKKNTYILGKIILKPQKWPNFKFQCIQKWAYKTNLCNYTFTHTPSWL